MSCNSTADESQPYVIRLAHVLKSVLQVLMQMVFNTPLSDAIWSLDRPLEQTPIFLFASRGMRCGLRQCLPAISDRKLSEVIAEKGQLNFTRLGCFSGDDNSSASFVEESPPWDNLEKVCMLPEVQVFFERVRSLQDVSWLSFLLFTVTMAEDVVSLLQEPSTCSSVADGVDAAPQTLWLCSSCVLSRVCGSGSGGFPRDWRLVQLASPAAGLLLKSVFHVFSTSGLFEEIVSERMRRKERKGLGR